MPAPATIEDFLDVVRKSNQVDAGRLESYLEQHKGESSWPSEPKKLAQQLIRDGVLTTFQAEQFLQGKYKGFTLGGYRILERLGAGGARTGDPGRHEGHKGRGGPQGAAPPPPRQPPPAGGGPPPGPPPPPPGHPP